MYPQLDLTYLNLTMPTEEICSSGDDESFRCMLVLIFRVTFVLAKFLVALSIVGVSIGITGYILYFMSHRLITGKWPGLNEEE
jgi:hypothetical protein